MTTRSDDMIEIGKRLIMLREALGYIERGAQSEFAAHIGLTPQQLNNYERGLKRPEITQAIKICTRTGATLDWIYRGEWAGLPNDLAVRLRDLNQRQSA